MNPATRLHQAGQSLWLDDVTRELLDGGGLARYVAEAYGIDVPALAAELQSDGASAFVESWEALVKTIAARRAELGVEARR
ncbi:MAG: hypothetical protein J2P40_00930 [Candidatus Dormibacteraeota bacterium]|nr:hypothetical protein [Candidatus Dormibacteraeota bacterium]MBO0703753.1 hypothetical protein [Candidatus Dormibacteraeota bacterium]MBO0759811.1 hypothetical protein [Candidatus Dormibacteraeota bacterium]